MNENKSIGFPLIQRERSFDKHKEAKLPKKKIEKNELK